MAKNRCADEGNTSANNQRRWCLRPYREGDEHGIFELQDAVHPDRKYDREQWLAWWRWMFKKVPYDNRIWLVEDNGKIVAQFCGVYFEFKVGDKTKTVASGFDLSTHPGYRGQRIYLQLFNSMIDDMATTEVLNGFGFTNEASYRLALRRGFIYVPSRKFIKIVNWRNIGRTWTGSNLLLPLVAMGGAIFNALFYRSSRVAVIKGLSITIVPRFDTRINQFWNKISNQIGITLVRTDEYLNWRYASVPGTSYDIYLAEKDGAIVGYLVVSSRRRDYKDEWMIYDFMAESNEIAQNLVSVVTDDCRKKGGDCISWLGITGKAYYEIFRKLGFIPRPEQKESKFVVYSGDPDISREFISDPENWLIQMGDTDESGPRGAQANF
jgi:GNAT superfamily N-acetyltransferase